MQNLHSHAFLLIVVWSRDDRGLGEHYRWTNPFLNKDDSNSLTQSLSKSGNDSAEPEITELTEADKPPGW